ncbi:class I SAM-dependent methyltransferase [Entomomonas asaccharolytica]|uniref:Class I SAM-dependent methyltransferase n=1 Tax=Entomomonas asaccharolytica TaxID=2785331 RepID=A0A974NH29_9GAMM|nr:class I SAM-dependent methyltransferase [Entomomonas asaccharolytica]QQP86438.1 class I SAM-dependent methyltransferase [Entomomonas asaccharolytica]
MNITTIINREIPPTPWQSGEKIPWNEPAFSQRMLANHLSQEHDWASRRFEIIDQHIAWISQQLPNKQSKILDLGCGPGFYTHRLAEMGYQCTGVDFSPASIEHGKQQAIQDNLKINYILADIRHYQPTEQYDLIMMTFGEFNVFKESDIKLLLNNITQYLTPKGYLLIEAHTFNAILTYGQQAATWQSYKTGLFLDSPHICLEEHFWNEQQTTATTRYYIIDAINNQTIEYASSMKAYSDLEYQQLFQEVGMTRINKLTHTQWPTCDIFTEKLHTFICQK